MAGPQQEDGIQKPSEDKQVVTIDLDRFDLGLLKLPALNSILQDNKPHENLFLSRDRTTNEVKLNLPQKNISENSPSIAIIDCTCPLEHKEEVHIEDSEYIAEIKATHLGAVARVVAEQGLKIEKIYDVSNSDMSGFDRGAMITALDDLISYSKGTPIHAVNISLSTQVNFETLNNSLKENNLLTNDAIKVDNSNIINFSETIKELIRVEYLNSGSEPLLLNIAEKLQTLSDKGTAICIGAGNNSDDEFNLIAALVPDAVVVGGTSGSTELSTTYQKNSSQSSLNDTRQPFSYLFFIEKGGSFSLSGTSFSTPQALSEVAMLCKEGLSVKDINQLLRTRLAEDNHEKSQIVVVRDSIQPLILLGVAEEATGRELNRSQIEAIGLFNKRQLNMIDLFRQVQGLKTKEAITFVELMDDKISTRLVTANLFKEMLEMFSTLSNDKKLEFVGEIKYQPEKIDLEQFRSMLEAESLY